MCFKKFMTWLFRLSERIKKVTCVLVIVCNNRLRDQIEVDLAWFKVPLYKEY
jgi:hypothetical protein